MDLLPGARGGRELCQLVGQYDPARHPRHAVVEEKFDGIRALWLGGMGACTGAPIFTREGNPMQCAAHGLKELIGLQKEFGKEMFFDMEYVAGTFEDTNTAFKRRHPGSGVLHILDAVPFDVWAAGGRTAALSERKRILRDMQLGLGHTVCQRVSYQTADVATAAHWFQDITDRGGEGVIVKDATSPYVRHRSNTWGKWKIEQRTPSGKLRHPAIKG